MITVSSKIEPFYQLVCFLCFLISVFCFGWNPWMYGSYDTSQYVINENKRMNANCHDGRFLVDMTSWHDHIDCNQWNEVKKIVYSNKTIIQMYTEEQIKPLVGKSASELLVKGWQKSIRMLSTDSVPKKGEFVSKWPKIFSNRTKYANKVPIVSLYPNMKIAELVGLYDQKPFHFGDDFIICGALAENVGSLSSHVYNRTIDWINLPKQLARQICRNSSVRPWRPCQVQDLNRFMNNDRLRMFLSMQFSIIGHPKIVNLPLGLSKSNAVDLFFKYDLKAKKTNWLLISSSVWGGRKYVYSVLEKNFEGIKNQRFDFEKYYLALRSARFIAAPSGLGADCYRILEAIMFGCVPIIERGYHIERGYSKLPILVVDRWEDVNESFLKRAYVEILYNRPYYEPQRFLRSFWSSFVRNMSAKNMSSLQRKQYLLKEFPMPKKWTYRHYQGTDSL